MGQNHCCSVGAGDSDPLAPQGRDDLGGPNGVPSAPVFLELGVYQCLTCALQLGWGGLGGDRPSVAASCAWLASQDRLERGTELDERLALDAALGLVDLAGQVRVESREHRQGVRVLVRVGDGFQGVGHGLGITRCRVGDASHGQSGQVAHGDAHVLGYCHAQCPDGGGLVHHDHQAPVGGQLLVESA